MRSHDVCLVRSRCAALVFHVLRCTFNVDRCSVRYHDVTLRDMTRHDTTCTMHAQCMHDACTMMWRSTHATNATCHCSPDPSEITVSRRHEYPWRQSIQQLQRRGLGALAGWADAFPSGKAGSSASTQRPCTMRYTAFRNRLVPETDPRRRR